MKKYIEYKLIILVLMMATFVACDKASVDVSPIISPDYKPTVSFATSGTTGTEGDVLTVTITLSKPIDRAITFTPVITGGTADSHDFEADPVTLQPWQTEAVIEIITYEDADVSEGTENIEFDVAILGIAEKYLIHPDVVLPSYDFSFGDYFDPNKLLIIFSWDTEDDIDIVTFSEALGEWGDGGATAVNPEIDQSILLDDPVGTYYVNIMDWGADPFNYTFTIAQPNGTVQTFTGTFNRAGLIVDPWTAWGGSYDSYRFLKVVNDGVSFVVTAL